MVLKGMDERRMTELMLALHRSGGGGLDGTGRRPRGFAGMDELQDLAEIAAAIAGAIEGQPIDPAVLARWQELRRSWTAAQAA
jgi:hypothetical protein